MFSKIPQKLTAPFALLGDEAKLAFRSQPGGIHKLTSTPNIPETDTYWNQYTVLFDSASDVFSLITPHDVRRALLEAPENVATLLKFITTRLFTLISDHTFPSPPNASVTALASSFIKAGTGSSERNTTKEVLNCLRVLQRVLPVVFEVDGESSNFEMEALWKKEEIGDDVVELEDTAPQFVIEDDDEENETGDQKEPSRGPSSQPKQKKMLPSLAERLFSCLTDLLFCCGFTLPAKIQVDHYKINYVIWEKGIGSTRDLGPSHMCDTNKTEVLRLLLVLLSRQIYVPPPSLFTKPSLYSLHLTQKIPRRDVLTLLCSLLNTAMNSSLSSTTSIGSMAGKLPYNHLVFKGDDSRSTLVSTCFQVLCVLLDFQSGSAKDSSGNGAEGQISAPTAHTNAFRYFLAKLHRTQDFAFIVEGTAGILEAQMASTNNLLPGARKSIPYVTETVILFWKIVELNKKFRAYALESEKAMDLVAYLLCYGLEQKDKPQQHGLCRAISYIVQTLSAEPAFGFKLSSPVKTQLLGKWNSSGTAADFMINAIYAMIATTSGTLNSIYPALIIALSNLAPYFKNLTVVASTRLIQLFISFLNPLFLLSDEGHPRLLFFMLEVFNSVILRNLSENPNLVYGILTSHKAFEDLGTFTLSRGLREIKRVQMAKEEQARKSEGNPKAGNGVDAGTSEEPQDEKARLLGSESGDAFDHSTGTDSAENLNVNSRLPEGLEGQPHYEQHTQTIHPIMSPIDNLPTPSGTPSAISGKVMGKMKERRSMSMDTSSSLDRIAAISVGKNGFVPTQEWVTSWQKGLPLDPVMLLISELLPKIQELQASRHKTNLTSAIMDLLGSVTLKHVLPPPPKLTPRKFLWSDSSIIWLTSLIWGEIYVRGMSPLGIWNATNVRLFYVKHAQTQPPRQITETVSRFLGRNSDPTQVRQRQERS